MTFILYIRLRGYSNNLTFLKTETFIRISTLIKTFDYKRPNNKAVNVKKKITLALSYFYIQLI